MDATMVKEEGVRLARTFTGQNSSIECVAYAPSMKQTLSGSKDGSIMVWNFRPQQRAYRLRGHKGAVLALDMAASEEVFASGSADHTVRLWEPSIRGSFKEFKAHAGAVCGVKFSEDGRLLVTASADKMLKLWDVSSLSAARPRFLWCVHGHRNWVRAADMSKGSFRVCSGGDDKLVKVWDAATGAGVASFDDHSDAVRTVQFDPLSGVCVASAGADGTINLWDVRSQYVVQHYELKHKSTIRSVRFHPSGNYLLSTSEDAAVRVWDLREGRLLYTINAHTRGVHASAFSKDGTHFVTGGDEGVVLAWGCESLCDPPGGEQGLSPMDEALVNQQIELDRETRGRTKESSKPRKRSHSKGRRHSKHATEQGATHEGRHHHHSRRRSKSQADEEAHHRHRSGSRHRRSVAAHRAGHVEKPSKHERRHSKRDVAPPHDSDDAIDLPAVEEAAPRRRKSTTRHASIQELRRLHEEQRVAKEAKEPEPLAPTPSSASSALGQHTRAAIQAAIRRKTGDESDAASSISNRGSATSAPLVSSQHIQTLARAMENLEARLRMNEDALADLRHSQAELSQSLHSDQMSADRLNA